MRQRTSLPVLGGKKSTNVNGKTASSKWGLAELYNAQLAQTLLVMPIHRKISTSISASSISAESQPTIFA